MQNGILSTRAKAVEINQDPSRYGTFAEIGAGQEVARYFFKAGYASRTIAKSISAYDMTFSDEIYGKCQRYVSHPRLLKMLDHEYALLDSRLSEQRGNESSFFVFADTVATSSHEEPSHCHGWLGVRFQSRPQGPVNDIILHVHMKDRFRLQQQEALGVLGVNLLHNAIFSPKDSSEFVARLTDNIGQDRIEVNFIQFNGEDLLGFDSRKASLELVHQGLTHAMLFDPSGKVVMAADELYKKPLLVQRGTFRPVTTTQMEIIKNSRAQLKKSHELEGQTPQILFEISMNTLKSDGQLDFQDFLDRVDLISSLGHYVLISDFQLFFELKQFLRMVTDNYIALIIGAPHVEKLMSPEYYHNQHGEMLQAFGLLFDEKARIYVYPYKSETLCLTAETFHPDPSLEHLYKHFLQNRFIVDVLNCDDVDTSIHSDDVQKMLLEGNPQWEKFVPPSVSQRIKERKLFQGKKN